MTLSEQDRNKLIKLIEVTLSGNIGSYHKPMLIRDPATNLNWRKRFPIIQRKKSLRGIPLVRGQ